MTEYITPSDLDTHLGPDERARLALAGITPDRYAQTILEINDEVGG